MTEDVFDLRLPVVSIQVGLPRQLPAEASGKPWTSGIIKRPVSQSIAVDWTNLAGDGQADLVHHGGADKAVLVYPAEHFRQWQSEFPEVAWDVGSFGENLTTTGGSEAQVCIGDVFELGTCRLQVSQPRQPCWKLSRRWGIASLAVRVQQTGRTGWYLRVVQRGRIEAGDVMSLRQRDYPEWTIAAANQVMYGKPRDEHRRRELAACEALSEAWRSALTRRDRR